MARIFDRKNVVGEQGMSYFLHVIDRSGDFDVSADISVSVHDDISIHVDQR